MFGNRIIWPHFCTTQPFAIKQVQRGPITHQVIIPRAFISFLISGRYFGVGNPEDYGNQPEIRRFARRSG